MRQLPWKPSDTDFWRRKLPWKPSDKDFPRRQLSWKPSGTDFQWRPLPRKPSEKGGAIGAPVAGRESGGSKPVAAALPHLQPALATVTFGVTGLDPDDDEVNMSKADSGIRMAAALEKLAAAASPGVASIEDPVAWQREVRSDRQSAADVFRQLALLPEDFMSEGRQDEPPQEREPD